MVDVVLRFVVVNAEYYGAGAPEAISPTEVEVVCDSEELLVSVVQRAGVGPMDSRLWSDFVGDGEGHMGLWAMPTTLALHLGRLRTDSIAPYLLHVDLTVRDAVAYFAGEITDAPALALYPAAPIGGGPLDILVELAGSAHEYFGQRTAWDVGNDVLTIYGGAEIMLSVQRYVVRRRLRRLHRDARSWLHQTRVTRRIARLIDSRDSWECRKLAAILGLDHATTGRLLRARGFVLDSADLTTWLRAVSVKAPGRPAD